LAKNSGFKIKKYKIITPTTWSILQVENMLLELKEGKKHSQWGSVQEKENMTVSKKIVRGVLYACMLFLRLVFSIVNKLLDFMHIGDGTVIFLEKK
jgi:hypothetical protein